LHLKIIKLLWLDVPFLSVFFFFFCIFIEGPISATGPRQKRKRWKLYLPYLVFPILPCMTNWLTSLYDKLVLISFFFLLAYSCIKYFMDLMRTLLQFSYKVTSSHIWFSREESLDNSSILLLLFMSRNKGNVVYSITWLAL
jgi:hypothetical protein